MRLASGAAHGVQQTVAGLRMNETPSPVRPRVLELMEDQLAVSEAGSQEAVTATASATAGTFEQEVMEQLKALRAENDKLKTENEELKKKNESPGAVSSEIFGEPASERQAEEEQQQEAGAEDVVEDWSGQGSPMIEVNAETAGGDSASIEGKPMFTKVSERSLREASENPPGLLPATRCNTNGL